jgi:pyruvate dehydrogenase E1 component alpha subunit/2-oxoisovalerate dehydrogenase E1 component alpha subunit
MTSVAREQAMMELHQVLNEKGEVVSDPPDLPSKALVQLYRHMLRIRIIDERMMTLQRQGRVGFYGACTGQEAAVIGSAFALEPDDWIFPALREGGAALMRGYSLEHYVAQVMGARDDLQKGRQMPCHYGDRSVNYVSWSSCIATQLPHAVGTALAMKLRKRRSLSIVYLGDGATSEGDFHVAMNFAGVLQAPILFFCQNNQWAISVSVKQQTASDTIAVKALAYGFGGIRIDGNDVLAIYRETRRAVESIRRGEGPVLIEALTYRMGAHSSSDDPSRYRDERVTEKWKKKDPLLRYRAYLERKKLWDEARDQAATDEFQSEMTAAIQKIESTGPPAKETLFEDVYARKPWHLQEQESG